jgi:uncharacterized membrane protein required for colicin V production
MWLNALAAIVLAACIAAGAWSGALATGLRIATLVIAYGVAVMLGPALAPRLGARVGVAGPVAIALAGSVLFISTYLVLGIAARFARRLGRLENVGRSPRDRILGATFGAARGALLAMMIVYLAMWLDALRATGTAVVPEIGDSVAAEVTSEVVESAIESAIDTSEPTARFTTRLAAHPAASAADLQRVIENENFTALRSDAAFWADVEAGLVDTAVWRGSFQRLARDASVRQMLANLGFVPEAAVHDEEVFRQSIAQVLGVIGPRLRGLRDDPAVQELLADPAVVAMAQNGDAIGLLANPRIRLLVSRLSAAGP